MRSSAAAPAAAAAAGKERGGVLGNLKSMLSPKK
jgi:hypothetical protein